MRVSGRVRESLSKLFLTGSPSSTLSRPHTHPFLTLQTLSNLQCPSVRKKPFLYCTWFSFSSWAIHQHGPPQRTTRASMLGECSSPAHPMTSLSPVMRKSLHTQSSSLHLNCTWTMAEEHHNTQPDWSHTPHDPGWAGMRGKCDLLGTRLIAFRGLRTRTVRIADKLMFWRSREYSTILQKGRGGERKKKTKFKRMQNFDSSLKSFWKPQGWSLRVWERSWTLWEPSKSRTGAHSSSGRKHSLTAARSDNTYLLRLSEGEGPARRCPDKEQALLVRACMQGGHSPWG